jgi:hypothetical protein
MSRLTEFTVATQNRGTDWIDLASDQCTMFYTSEGTSVKRFNVCTNTQGTDFSTALNTAYAFHLLPGGGALVANSSNVNPESTGSGMEPLPFFSILLAAPTIPGWIGPTGQRIVSKIMGLITAVIGIQFVINGVTTVFVSILEAARG